MNGLGIYYYRDGSSYEGEFYRDQKDGIGKLTIKLNQVTDKYEGQFKDGQFDGNGKYIIGLDNTIFQGQFCDGYAEGDVYNEFDI